MPDQINPKLEIRDSRINGKGIFAAAPIKKDEVVLSWNPKVLTKEQAEELSEDERDHYTYPEGDYILLMQPPERFLNHSCEPSTYVVGRSDVALRDIQPGEEITSDYLDLDTEDFQCKCGSKKCRGAKNEV